jgi:hypothetical protein
MGAAKTRGGILVDEDTYEEAKSSINIDFVKLEEVRVKVSFRSIPENSHK